MCQGDIMLTALTSALDRLWTAPGLAPTVSVALAGLGFVATGMWVGRRRQRSAVTRTNSASLDASTPSNAAAPPRGARQRKSSRRAGAWTRVTIVDLQAGGPFFEGRVIDF